MFFSMLHGNGKILFKLGIALNILDNNVLGKKIHNEKRLCKKCEQISYLSDEVPKISDDFPQVFSAESAYQTTSMLEGVIKRGTGIKQICKSKSGKKLYPKITTWYFVRATMG